MVHESAKKTRRIRSRIETEEQVEEACTTVTYEQMSAASILVRLFALPLYFLRGGGEHSEGSVSQLTQVL